MSKDLVALSVCCFLLSVVQLIIVWANHRNAMWNVKMHKMQNEWNKRQSEWCRKQTEINDILIARVK